MQKYGEKKNKIKSILSNRYMHWSLARFLLLINNLHVRLPNELVFVCDLMIQKPIY